LSGEIDEIAALMPPDDCSPFDEVDDDADESDDGVDDWLDDDAPRPLLPIEPVLPAAELMFDDEDCEPIDELEACDDGEPGAEPEVDEPVLPRLPLDEALCWLVDNDDDGDELVLLRFDDALCWLPDEAVVPLFRLESWLLPMLEPALLASMPLPSVDF